MNAYDPCTVCGNETHEERAIMHIFTTPAGQKVVIKNIPATVCTRCGEITFSLETTTHILSIVGATSEETVAAAQKIPVFEYV
jgi:HTH-type transcriptional regulator / antitoxin MqsA